MANRFNSNEDLPGHGKTAEFREGVEAHMQGCFIQANPYPNPSIAFRAWNAGWVDQDMVAHTEGNDCQMGESEFG